MANQTSCQVPFEEDFLAAFGVEATEKRPADGFWAYVFQDDGASTVRLSFNSHERSVQTSIAIGDREIATVSMENATGVRIDEADASVIAEFSVKGAEIRMVLRISPELGVTWSGLSTSG